MSRLGRQYGRNLGLAGERISYIEKYSSRKQGGIMAGDSSRLETYLEVAETALKTAQALKANFGIESRKLGNLLDLMPAARAKVKRVGISERGK